jgi:hypothetical protein
MRLRQVLTTASALCIALWASACGTTAIVGPEHYTLIATDFVGGLKFIDASVPPSLSDDGHVAFVGSRTSPFIRPEAIFVGHGGPLSVAQTETAGYTQLTAVQYAASGELVFIGEHTPVATALRGVFRTTSTGASYSTLLEGRTTWSFGDADTPPPRPYTLAMSPNGTVGFSTIVNAAGGLYRVPPGGSTELLRGASGTYFNSGFKAREFDVNDAGAVAVQLEYSDPNAGLSRGLFVFDAPGDTLATIESTVMRQGVGSQPALALNGSGQMAFALNGPVTIQYFHPPLPGGGAPAASQTLGAGVYLATPAPFGTPFTFTQIAAAAGGYSNFGRVDVNDSGVVVFEANYDGEKGIFSGSDPIVDRVAITGRLMIIGGQPNFFSVVQLGQLNNHNQVSIQTSDSRTTDQRIWRIDAIR